MLFAYEPGWRRGVRQEEAMKGRWPSRGAALIGAALACGALSGCESVAIAAFGVGGSTAVNHTLTGITYRTFTAPLSQVKTASVTALNRMGMRRAGGQKSTSGETILAKATDRD